MTTYKNASISDGDDRKKDHIDLALRSRADLSQMDNRFYYEPLFGIHPNQDSKSPVAFLNHQFDFPFWVSSMTGGTEKAELINHRLAELCQEFNLGMGLGSIRPLLESNNRFKDFDIRKTIGQRPLYANLGIAQLDEVLKQNQSHKLEDIIESLQVNGLFIHLNPLQEWFQPEGDRFTRSSLSVIEEYLSVSKTKVIVKEVGHGMGPESLKALLKLDIQGIEFGAFGGTNFSLLEQARAHKSSPDPLSFVGHSALEMVGFVNALGAQKDFIISGGVSNMLDAYYLQNSLNSPSVIGFASQWLTPALESYEALKEYFKTLSQQYLVCEAYLKIKEKESM